MTDALSPGSERTERRLLSVLAAVGLVLLALVAAAATWTAVDFGAITADVPDVERANAPHVERAVRVAAAVGWTSVALLALRAFGPLRRPAAWVTVVAGVLVGLSCALAVVAVGALWI
ncbi:hypothetical protein ACVU7I_10260 [Patulibacter sp. S7RM1-6]